MSKFPKRDDYNQDCIREIAGVAGIGIIYFLISMIRLIMMSFLNTFSKMAQSHSDGFDAINKMLEYQKMLSIAAIILSAFFILGGIGYALRREWGRKIYIAVCALGIGYHLFSGYITFFLMNEATGPFQSGSNGFATGFSAVTWIFTSLIPLAYLTINIIIAGRPKTKAVMKK